MEEGLTGRADIQALNFNILGWKLEHEPYILILLSDWSKFWPPILRSSAVSTKEAEISKIGLALSGGGSRAIAFHLGCLRTLHRLGLMEKVVVMSSVSGGSVIAAMYAVHEGTFEEFDHWVRSVLQTGFFRPALRTALTTLEGVKAVICFSMLVISWLYITPFRYFATERWVPRRFASRTTILRRTFDDLLFKGKTLGDLRSRKPRLLTVATELRTGSAFYFTTHEAGSYRLGSLDPSQIRVAQAVAASAAYPLFLPALDEVVTCRRSDGSLRNERVILTDGGIYDNLGLGPLWPDRDKAVSIAVEPVDFIVASRAGYGRRMGQPSQFIGSRMKAAFYCVFDRAQNLTNKRLYDLNKKDLKGFILPYLDQDDRRLAYPPAGLVTREAVLDYPTDFSAMPPEWIEKLSKRGEQLTLAVIREHAPWLLPPEFRDGSNGGSNVSP